MTLFVILVFLAAFFVIAAIIQKHLDSDAPLFGRGTLILVGLFVFSSLSAQEIVQEGNQFTVKSNKEKKQEEVVTPYTYKDKDGVYVIYLSSKDPKKAKAFIKKRSKKTGKKYRKYLPEVGKKINPAGYQSSTQSITYGLCKIN